MGGLLVRTSNCLVLHLDLWIVDCESRDDHPFIQVSGNLDNPEITCGGPIITLGTKSSCHYQSLIPTEIFHLEFDQILIPESIRNITKYAPTLKDKDSPWQAKIEANEMQSNATSCKAEHEKSNEVSCEEIQGRMTRNISPLNNTNVIINKGKDDLPFMYKDNGKVLIFQQLSHDYLMRCPQCKMETKQIIQHLAKSKD